MICSQEPKTLLQHRQKNFESLQRHQTYHAAQLPKTREEKKKKVGRFGFKDCLCTEEYKNKLQKYKQRGWRGIGEKK